MIVGMLFKSEESYHKYAQNALSINPVWKGKRDVGPSAAGLVCALAFPPLTIPRVEASLFVLEGPEAGMPRLGPGGWCR